MSVVQSRGRGRTGLGEVQGRARSGSGLRSCIGVVDQGSVATTVGSDDDGGIGSGLLWTRWHRRVRARMGASSGGAQGTDGRKQWRGSGHVREQAAAGLRARTQCRRLCMPRMLGAKGAVNGME